MKPTPEAAAAVEALAHKLEAAEGRRRRRRSTEADDLSLAIGSLVVENEPDALPRNRVQRLAIASAVAPALRRGADVAARRRVTIEAPGQPWSAAGETTLLETQKALLATYAEVISLKAQDSGKDTSSACVLCSRPAPRKPDGRGQGRRKPLCAACAEEKATCAGWNGTCDAAVPEMAYLPCKIVLRQGEPWRCAVCANRRKREVSAWHQKNAAHFSTGPRKKRARA